MPARIVLVAALAIACHGALAQTQTVPPALTVQRLAPQLVAFAGSDTNFQSLVNGLAAGTQVQLFSVLPSGFTQTVTFTPTAALAPAQIAQILEAARQQLIGLGIGNPTAEQIGFSLMGGLVPTALGGAQVAGFLSPQAGINPSAVNPNNPPSPAAQIQSQAAAGATAPAATTTTSAPGLTNSVNVQTTPSPTSAQATSTAGVPRSTSDSVIAPGGTSRTPLPLTSASPTFNTSASPLPATPLATPGPGVTPQAFDRVPANARPARN